MNNIDKYIKFIKDYLTEYFKLIVKDKYKRIVYNEMLNTYIDIRYFNKYDKKYKQIEKNIEYYIQENLRTLIEEDNKLVKNVNELYYFFWYLLYLDNTLEYDNLDKLIDKIIIDRKEKLDLNDDITKELKSLVKESEKKKNNFFNEYLSDTFNLELKSTNIKNVYNVLLSYNIKFPKIYSSYSINRVFKSDIISEDMCFIEYNLISKIVLDNIINKEYNKECLVDFPFIITSKKEKTNRLLNIITNDLIRENVIIKVTYEYYTKYKSFISDLIKDGVKFAVIIDDTFDYEESSIIWLNIFTYIITNKDDVTSFDKNKVIFKERM
ncbi:unknown [Clostridium sp. CAG:628]|nr:unknown [Clostridium sp. CAG:628]